MDVPWRVSKSLRCVSSRLNYEVNAVTDAKGCQSMASGSVPVDRLSGQSLVLTIDARIQEVAERILAKRRRDAREGRGRCGDGPQNRRYRRMGSEPALDPNQFGNFLRMHGAIV